MKHQVGAYILSSTNDGVKPCPLETENILNKNVIVWDKRIAEGLPAMCGTLGSAIRPQTNAATTPG